MSFQFYVSRDVQILLKRNNIQDSKILYFPFRFSEGVSSNRFWCQEQPFKVQRENMGSRGSPAILPTTSQFQERRTSLIPPELSFVSYSMSKIAATSLGYCKNWKGVFRVPQPIYFSHSTFSKLHPALQSAQSRCSKVQKSKIASPTLQGAQGSPRGCNHNLSPQGDAHLSKETNT